MWVGLKRTLTSTFSWGDWLPIVHRAPGRGRRVVLTFDDGPSPETTPAILHLLNQRGASATFFVCGARAEAYPELLADIVRAGHSVYAHGYTHRRLDLMDEQDAIREIVATEEILRGARPTPSPYLVRLPYGSGHRNARIHRLLHGWRRDCHIAHWGYDFQDFRLAENCVTLCQLEKRCDEAIARSLYSRKMEGSVVLLHEDPFDAKGIFVPRIAETLLLRLLSVLNQEKITIMKLAPVKHPSFFSRYVRTVAIQ